MDVSKRRLASSDNMINDLHPIALTTGIIIIFFIFILCLIVNKKKETIKQIARKTILRRKDIKKNDNNTWTNCKLPNFVIKACETDNIRIVKRWIHSIKKDIAMLNARCDEQRTAIHYAVKSENADILRYLLENGADPNVCDGRGSTGLHIACQNGHALCVKLLIDYHVDPYIENIDHYTALQIAEKEGNIGCSRLLQRCMFENNRSESCYEGLSLRNATINNV